MAGARHHLTVWNPQRRVRAGQRGRVAARGVPGLEASAHDGRPAHVARGARVNPVTGGAASQLAGLCLPHVPRALALMDRDVLSPTYGSMDRSYWYYRTLTNFPGAVWQQPMVG